MVVGWYRVIVGGSGYYLFILVLLRNGGLINNLKLWQEEQSVEKLECSPTYYLLS